MTRTPVFDLAVESLQELGLKRGEYVIHASGPLGAWRIRDVGDLDVVVTKDQMRKLARRFKVRSAKLAGLMCVCGYVEFYDEMPYLDKDEVFKTAEEVRGVMCAPLSEVRKWKSFMGRDKDLRDVALIDEFLKERQS